MQKSFVFWNFFPISFQRNVTNFLQGTIFRLIRPIDFFSFSLWGNRSVLARKKIMKIYLLTNRLYQKIIIELEETFGLETIEGLFSFTAARLILFLFLTGGRGFNSTFEKMSISLAAFGSDCLILAFGTLSSFCSAVSSSTA